MTDTTTDAAEARAREVLAQHLTQARFPHCAERVRFRIPDAFWDAVRNAMVAFATAEAASGAGARGVFPAQIGRLSLGEHLSDGEDRQCAGGCEQPIPAGHAIYWPERIGEYPDDIDPACISCAIAKAETEQGWCECEARAAVEAAPTIPATEGTRAGMRYIGTPCEDCSDGACTMNCSGAVCATGSEWIAASMWAGVFPEKASAAQVRDWKTSNAKATST